MSTILAKDNTMIERMELDLASKAAEAFTQASVAGSVYGVFSLDDLEAKMASELGRKVAVGVGYSHAEPVNYMTEFNPQKSASSGQSSAAKVVQYFFLVVLAVPTGKDCEERYNATMLLTVLRRRIHGSVIDGDITARRWNFMQEKPNTEQSTEDLLFYSQLWQVSIPLSGPTP